MNDTSDLPANFVKFVERRVPAGWTWWYVKGLEKIDRRSGSEFETWMNEQAGPRDLSWKMWNDTPQIVAAENEGVLLHMTLIWKP